MLQLKNENEDANDVNEFKLNECTEKEGKCGCYTKSVKAVKCDEPTKIYCVNCKYCFGDLHTTKKW